MIVRVIQIGPCIRLQLRRVLAEGGARAEVLERSVLELRQREVDRKRQGEHVHMELMQVGGKQVIVYLSLLCLHLLLDDDDMLLLLLMMA